MKKSDTAPNETFFMYKNKPLVRCNDTIYYGNMADDYVVKFHIKKLSVNKELNMEIAEKVSIQLMSTDPNMGPRKRIVKSGEKEGLYQALDIAEVWLNKALTSGDDIVK